MNVLLNRLYRSKLKFILSITAILTICSQIAIAPNLSEGNNSSADTKCANGPVVREFFVAVEEIPASTDVINFNLTSKKCPALLFRDPAKDLQLESLNFSIKNENNDCNIPAASFEYTTSMYTDNDNTSRISWVGQPYLVTENNNENMHIARLLIDEDMDNPHLIGDGCIFPLPEGFAITAFDFFNNDGDQVDFLLTQNGEEKDKRTIKQDEMYHYNPDMNTSGQIENSSLRFYLEILFAGMCRNLAKINSIRMISSNVQVIDDNEPFSFNLDGATISWLGQPYYVIDHNNSGLTAGRLLIDEKINQYHVLRKGHTLFLPDGFGITVLETHPHIIGCGSSTGSSGYGNFSFILTQHSIEIDNRTISGSECYEYRLDLNGNGKNDNRVLTFNTGDIISGDHFADDRVEINSLKLISQDVLRIDTDEMNILREGYGTSIENDKIILTVQNNTENIPVSGTVSLMNNWFSVRENSASDAVAVSSKVIISDVYELIGAVENLYSGYAVLHLSSEDNPAVLYYDLENAQGHEILSFSVDKNYDPPYIHDPYRIPAGSFMYSTSIYSTRDNITKIAWLGEPYCVIGHNSSAIVLNKFLIDGHPDYSYRLFIDDPLDLPCGLSLMADINNDNITRLSLTKAGLEVYNTTASEGDIFQYKQDLNNNGIIDNLVLSFKVKRVNELTGSIIINDLRMISPESLIINDGDVLQATYTINIMDAGNTIEVRLKEKDINKDIILQEAELTDELTGILNDTFFIRVNGAVEVIKLLRPADIQQYERELTNRRVNFIEEEVPDIPENGINITDETVPVETIPDVTVPGFCSVICIVILLTFKSFFQNK